MKRATLLLLFVLFLSGCATTSIDSRRSERTAAYRTLKPEFQRLVDEGRIAVGMPADAVYIAWGKASEVIQGQSAQGPTETWRYYATRARPYRYWDYGPYVSPSHGFIRPYESDYYNYNTPIPYLERDYYPQHSLRGEVTLQNGLVQHWVVPSAAK